MRNGHKVKLNSQQRAYLERLVRNGTEKVKKLMHAWILIKSDLSKGSPGLQTKRVAKELQLNPRTVLRVKERFALEGLEAAINRRVHKQYKPHKLDGEQESRLIAICCSQAPAGRARWTVELLGAHLVRLHIVDDISRSTIYRTLKKTHLSLG
jgi:transposase